MTGMKQAGATSTLRPPRRTGTAILLLAGGLLMCVCFVYSAYMYPYATASNTRNLLPSRLMLAFYAVWAITSTAAGMWLLGVRFRLSTWFVLAAILCWAMATRPWIVETQVTQNLGALKSSVTAGSSQVLIVPIQLTTSRLSRTINVALVWPALALLTFIAWKAAWAIRRRRTNRAIANGSSPQVAGGVS